MLGDSEGSSRRILRRVVVWTGGVAFLVGALLWMPRLFEPAEPPVAEASADVKRNLLIVCFDTVRYDSFWLPERAGYADELSPWLERALRLHEVQTPAPWTVPAVASLMTGDYPVEHGAGRFPEPKANLAREVPSPLPDEAQTLTERLSAEGYSTGAFVSHPWFAPKYGLSQGMDKLKVWRGAENLVEHSLHWLDETAEPPWFAYLHFMEAHDRHTGRYTPGAKLDQRLEDEVPLRLRQHVVELAPDAICGDPQSVPCRRYQLYVDSVVGLRGTLAGLLEELRERSALEHTVVVLYSDHGEEFQDHGKWGHGHSLYQELLHVPVVVWHPDLPAGGDSTATVSLAELQPLLLRWLRTASSRKDSLPAPQDLVYVPERPRPLYSSGIAYGFPQSAVKLGRWKRILREEPEEQVLYDLNGDPLEQRPVENVDVAKDLDSLLQRYAKQAEELGEGPSVALSEEEIEQLQSLGYLDAL